MTSIPRIRRQFKVCLIGDGYVGKSSIRRTYLREGFKRSYIPTLGVDFAQKSMKYNGVSTNLVIWDIAGQPAYAGLRKRYYEGASGLILVYSVVDRTSFDNASKWLVEAKGFVQNLPPMIIAANKIDLSPSHPEEEIVTPEEGREFAESFSKKLNTPVYFIETSALKGINIDEVFLELVRMMVDGIESKHISPREETPVHPPEGVATREVTSSSTTDAQEEAHPEEVTTSATDAQEEVQAEEVAASTMMYDDSSIEVIASTTEPQEKAHSEEVTTSVTETLEETSSEEVAASTMTHDDSSIEVSTTAAEVQEEVRPEELTTSATETPEEAGSEEVAVFATGTREYTPSETAESSALGIHEETTSETGSSIASMSDESTTYISESFKPEETEIDPVTSQPKDSAYLQEDRIGREMTKLVDLRAELKNAEEELANVISEIETALLNLRNVVHVKKIMYEHLKKELDTTRKEWAQAYNDYLNTEQRRKDELAKHSKQIEDIRKSIEQIGKIVRSRVSDLEMKRFSE